MGTLRLLVFAAALAALPAAPAQAASWSAAATVPGSKDASRSHVALAPDGTVAVGWYGAGVGIRRPDGRWYRARAVATPGTTAGATDLAFDRRGRLLVTWVQSPSPPGRALKGPFQIRAATWTRTTGWGGVRVLGRAGHFILADPRIALNARDDAMVFWRGFRRAGRRVVEAVATSFRPAGGRFGLEQRVADGGPYRAVAIDARGNGYAVWTTVAGPVNRFAYRPRGRGWGRPQTIAGHPASLPTLAVLPDRSALVAWREATIDSEGDGTQYGPVRAVVRAPSGRFGPVLEVSQTLVHEVQVAVSPQGEALLAWSPPDSDPPVPGAADLRFAVRPSGGEVGRERSVPGARAGPVAYLREGSALVVYAAEDAVRAIVRARGSPGFGAPETVSPVGFNPSLAVSGTRAVAAWFDRASSRLKLAVRHP